MKNRFALLAGLAVLGWNLAAIAAPPDPETDALIRQRYDTLLFSSRSCAYFANPKTIESSGDNRYVWVLNAGTDDTGTVCRGVFRFLWLTVNCQTNMITFTDSAPSLEEQQRKKIEYLDEALSKKVCQMPAKPRQR
jgi:hypothetical protein